MPNRFQTKDDLLKITNDLPDDAFFIEHSREREITYVDRSFTRWNEILDIARGSSADLSKLSCLDIGSSPFTFQLKGLFEKVYALDLSDSLRPRCEAHGIDFRGGGVTSPESLESLEKVDFVFCLEVLEHLHANPVEVISNLRSLLKPGGTLILSTPNMMCFANRVLMLLNRPLHHFDKPPFSINDAAHGYGHDRIYMPAELRNYCAAAGFKQVENRYQLHVNDMAHEGHSQARRLLELVPAIAKRIMPSVRDGIIMVCKDS